MAPDEGRKDRFSKDSHHWYEKPPTSVSNSVAISKKHTLLQTARANIGTINGKCEEVRVLFDSCSQRSFINSDISLKLKLPIIKKERMIVKAFETENEKPRLIDIVHARVCGVEKIIMVEVELCVIKNICSHIAYQTIELAQATYEHMIKLDLADRTDGHSELKIDVLIGADFYWKFITGETIRCKGGPVALNTVLGWVLSGPLDSKDSHVTTNHVSNHVLKIDSSTIEPVADRDNEMICQISKFWEIEEVRISEPCEKISQEFRNSIVFDDTLRCYLVELPWRCDPEILPDNYSLAKC